MLQEAGHVAYFAGGCVRDMLLGQSAADYDVATDAHPEQVMQHFPKARLVGEAFGVALVRMYRHDVEVATFRTEWGYADGRHPDHVQFSDAEHDARRRDFTVNGMFYDPIADCFHDFVNGQDDLEHRIIRAIGDPPKRFAEDYLRLLRAVRFATKLQFDLEPATADAIYEHASRLDAISRERIGMELEMMLTSPSRAAAAEMLQQFALDEPTFGEPTTSRPPTCLAALGGPVTFPSALAAWLVDRHMEPQRVDDVSALIEAVGRIKTVQIVRRWRTALMLSNADRQALRDLVTNLPAALDWDALDVAQQKRLLARDDWPLLHALRRAAETRHEGPRRDEDALEQQIGALKAEGVAPEPIMTGDDLIAAGFEPGPGFARLLKKVYDAQLMGRVGDKAAALALARDVAAGDS